MVQVGGLEPGGDAFADEIGEKNVLAGDGEEFESIWFLPHVADQIEIDPEERGDRSGPKAPGGSRVIFADAVEAMDEQCGGGAAEGEENGESQSLRMILSLWSQQEGGDDHSGEGDGGLGTEGFADADDVGKPEIIECAFAIGDEEAEK